ncbi:hypothetical protein VTI74DRAFT_954 [Chaetomium olivicolor]
MCFQEFLAYQCSHRSMAVVRTCPMATACHNFPVCSIKPDKIYYAETMCAACERQLHSRWVLIREWEHRWLHERGVCGCEVTFPGLLHTPRVIGETDPAEAAHPTAGHAVLALPWTEDRQDSSSASKAPVVSAAGSREGRAERHQSMVKSTTSDSNKKIPAIFTETITEDQHRVAIRLPSLYAAEWQADHRALHEAGKCSCPTDFTPFQPQIPDEELTPVDREVLRNYREMEEAGDVRTESDTPDENLLDPEAQRIAEIHKAFGTFTMESEPSQANSVSETPKDMENAAPKENTVSEMARHPLPPRPAVPLSPAWGHGREHVGQGHGRRYNNSNSSRHSDDNGRYNNNGRFNNNGPYNNSSSNGRYNSRPSRQFNNRAPYQPSGRHNNHTPMSAPQHSRPNPPFLASDSSTQTHAQTQHSNPHQGHHPAPSNPTCSAGIVPIQEGAFRPLPGSELPSAPQHPPQPCHQHYQHDGCQYYYYYPAAFPCPFQPAFPAFATPATYSNTIPPGALPWASVAKRSEHMRGVVEGTGPYKTLGFDYSQAHAQTRVASGGMGLDDGGGAGVIGDMTRVGQGSGAGLGQGVPHEQVQVAGYAVEQQQHRHQQQGEVCHQPQQQCISAAPLPLCGLPMGAGPEGISHVPSWMKCRLRTGGASVSMEGSASISMDEEHEVVGQADKVEEGGSEGHFQGDQDEGDDEDNDQLATPSPPPRCQSAYT